MKKIACIFFLTLILQGCDDGNQNVDIIDFADAQPESCTNGIIYKLNENESMLLQMPEGTLTEDPTESGKPTNYVIDNTNYRVIYRAYNGKVTAETICNLIPPALPTVTNQWTATGGIIQITTSPNISPGPNTNSTRITGYTYSILFKNITYLKSDGPQVEEDVDFGDYKTIITPLNLTFKTDAFQCSDFKQLYNFNSGASLTIDNIDPNLLINEPTTPDAPRTGLISATTNKLSYKVYEKSALTADYFCKTPPPALPIVAQTWFGVNGVATVSGIIQVQTETSGPNTFKHTISLISVTLQNGNNTFKLGDSFLFGELFTTSTP